MFDSEKPDFYSLADGRIWSISAACFVDATPEAATVAQLYADGRPGDANYLRKTLDFYGYPVGEELLTDEDRAVSAREKRDGLLKAADFYLMPDYPIEQEKLAAIKAYRQALRDVPEQPGFPTAIEWPEPPEGLV